jgi:hypothetical protein
MRIIEIRQCDAERQGINRGDEMENQTQKEYTRMMQGNILLKEKE